MAKFKKLHYLNRKLQNLINQIRKCKLPAMKAIKFNGRPCNKLDNLWNTLHQLYNSA